MKGLMDALEQSVARARRQRLREAEGFCCIDSCCGPGSWCCAHADPHDHEEEMRGQSR